MSSLEFTARIVEAMVWPAAIFAIAYFLRKYIKELRYRGFGILFREDAEGTLRSMEGEEDESLKTAEQIERIDNPRLAILDAWKKLEESATTKLNQLAPEKNLLDRGPDGALRYFEYMGALVPRTKRALSELRNLQSRAIRSPQDAIPIEGASAYVRASSAIQRQIEALSSLPEMKLNRLTLLILEYNSLIDSGKYNDITIQDIHREIEQGTVLRYIQKIAGLDADMSLYLDTHDEFNFEAEYAKNLQVIYGGYAGRERRKWGVENLGALFACRVDE